jgi:hypothetical protein
VNPFQPLADRARWRILYEEVFSKVDHGDQVTYEQMGKLLELDPEVDRHTIQMAVRRAAHELEEADKLALDAVPNVGYRVVQVLEHMQLARRQQRRSHRALKSGRSKVVNVDFKNMEPETRKAFEIMAQAFAMQMDFNRRIDVRQAHLEKSTRVVVERQERSESEIAQLLERLARLEKQVDSDIG